MKVVNAEEMRALDLRATREFGIPSRTLMENAGNRTFARIEARYGPVGGLRIVVVAGSGNNGGDGLVAARQLAQAGARTTVYLLSGEKDLKEEPAANLDAYRKGGWEVVSGEDDPERERFNRMMGECDLILDAIFGTGLSRPVDEKTREVIRKMNASGKKTVALDIPSGVSADTGAILGEAVRADCTVTYTFPKWGHFLFPGAELTGDLFIEEIGLSPPVIFPGPETEMLDLPFIRKIFPGKRPRGSHKGNFGHLLVIAGSRGFRGAGALCCKAALRSGAGLVTWALPESLDRPDGYLQEAMTLPLPETGEGTLSLKAESPLLEFAAAMDAVVIGPGLSTRPETAALVRKLLTGLKGPLVIDADGINALAGEGELLKKARGPVLLTPHPGEMGRLLGLETKMVIEGRRELPAGAAARFGCAILLKGAYSILSFPDGSVRINSTGNPGMATAGTGDVLSGILGGLLAQRLPFRDAASIGVYLHGLAGDLACQERGEMSMIAGDVIENISRGILKISRGDTLPAGQTYVKGH